MTKLILLISGLLLILSASAQDMPDYSATDPDNLVNSIDTTKLSQEEAINNLKESVTKLSVAVNAATDSISKNIPNSTEGLRKDLYSLDSTLKNSKFIKSIVGWFEGTETVKGIKKDMGKEDTAIKLDTTAVKETPKKKNVD